MIEQKHHCTTLYILFNNFKGDKLVILQLKRKNLQVKIKK